MPFIVNWKSKENPAQMRVDFFSKTVKIFIREHIGYKFQGGSMKKAILIVCAGIFILSLGCLDSDTDITMELTNPSHKAVPFKIHYKLSDGGEVSYRDYTPKEYIVTLKRGQSLDGEVSKDTLDILEVVHFSLIQDGKEKLSDDITIGYVDIIKFHAPVE